MRRIPYPARWWWLLILACLPLVVFAQKEPHIGYVYPAGGQQGTTFKVILGGQNLTGASNIFFSGSGILVNIMDQERQVTPKEQQELKEKLSVIQKKRKAGERLTDQERDDALMIRKKLDAFGRRLANPSLGEFVTLQVTISSNAAPGKREVRLVTRVGVSNPRVFCVGRLPEVTKKEWKTVPKNKGTMAPDIDPKPSVVEITMPITLNGQITPGGVDRYTFRAHAGQQVVVVVSARELIPYLADAVPGWLQTTVVLSDSSGQEVECFDDYRTPLDPSLCFKISKDGDYVLAVRDSLYRGREDFIYRITVGELPFVTGIFPLGGKTGSKVSFALTGWNLPHNEFTLDFTGHGPGTVPARFVNTGRFSNTVPVAMDTLPECFEKESNDTLAGAQRVTLPVLINGRIDKPGDEDVFKFEGRAGGRVIAEVLARRLDSPLDSVLTLTDSHGKQLATNDDHDDKASGLNTHHADSYLTFTLLYDGAYGLKIGDTQCNGGGRYGYRLRLSAPRPDYELRVVPSSLNVRGGTSVPLTVYALRKDGFTGDIVVALKDAPKGFSLSSARIPEKEDKVKITLNAVPGTQTDPVSLHLEGRATIQDQVVIRPAVPADDMMQAFAYRHLVPAQNLEVMVVGRFKPWDSAKVLTPGPVKLSPGGTARIKVSLPVGRMIENVGYELVDAPDGVTIKSDQTAGSEIVIQADAGKVKPGQKGNLIIQASGERAMDEEKAKAPANKRRIPLGALPAISYEIVK